MGNTNRQPKNKTVGTVIRPPHSFEWRSWRNSDLSILLDGERDDVANRRLFVMLGKIAATQKKFAVSSLKKALALLIIPFDNLDC